MIASEIKNGRLDRSLDLRGRLDTISISGPYTRLAILLLVCIEE